MILRVPPTNLISNIARIPGFYLNNVNELYDASGNTVGQTSVSPYYQLGAALRLNHEQAAKVSKTYTLYGGEYQYVKVYSSASASGIRGRLAFWNTAALADGKWEVTGDVTTASAFLAGIFLNTVTAGYHTWIQTRGLAGVLNAATLLNATLGNQAFIEVALTGAVGAADFVANASATAAELSSQFGIAYQLPSAGSVTLVSLF